MNYLDISNKAASFRQQHGIELNGPIDILAIAQSINNLTIVFYPMKNSLSGLCNSSLKHPLIAINSTMSRGRQNFSIAHELYHLYFDSNSHTPACAKQIGEGSKVEQIADQFASYLLVPAVSLSEKLNKITANNTKEIELKDIIFLEQFYQVSRQAMLHRLRHEGKVSFEKSEKYKQNVILTAKSFGYDDSLYLPLPEDKQYGTYGYYINKAKDLLDKDIISNSKYEEFLLEAFRSDLVYGNDILYEELND